jgi:hypothetical protein
MADMRVRAPPPIGRVILSIAMEYAVPHPDQFSHDRRRSARTVGLGKDSDRAWIVME